MAHHDMITKPVRVELDLYELLEKEAVKETTRSGKIVQISTVTNAILRKALTGESNDSSSTGETSKPGKKH